MTGDALGPKRGPLAAIAHLGPGFVYIVHIFIAGTSRTESLPMHVSDKVIHFAAFGGMVPLVFLAVRYFRPRIAPGPGVAISAAISSALGAFLEFWQSFLPYRDAEFLDWVADTAGAILFGAGLLGVLLAAERFRPRDRSA
jgi:VanZ family protein